MNEPVAVPVQPQAEAPLTIESRVDRAHDEGQILDEGLDLSGYFGTHGKPYVADYFGLSDLYKSNEEIKGMVDTITEDVIKKADGQALVYVAKDMLDTYTNELNLKDNDTGIHKLKQVLKIINLKNSAKALDDIKSKVLADIENMV